MVLSLKCQTILKIYTLLSRTVYLINKFFIKDNTCSNYYIVLFFHLQWLHFPKYSCYLLVSFRLTLMLRFSFLSHILSLKSMLLHWKFICYELEIFVKLTFWVLVLKIIRLYKWVFLMHFHMNVSCKKSPH